MEKRLFIQRENDDSTLLFRVQINIFLEKIYFLTESFYYF